MLACIGYIVPEFVRWPGRVFLLAENPVDGGGM